MKRGIVFFLGIILLISFISAFIDNDPLEVKAEIQDEIQKLTYHAEQYESGNENYVHLLLHSSAVRQSLNEKLGAVGKHEGGILKQDQIEAILGDPTEMTKWVWAEGQDHDLKVDEPVPMWRKIVFDGNKIQIRLSAYPSIFTKRHFEKDLLEMEDLDEEERRRIKEELKEKERRMQEELGDLEGKIIYRLHFDIEFKKPQEQLDVKGRIDTIEKLANIYKNDPSSSNAEELAKESVNAEQAFQNFFRQGGGQCEDMMQSIFGIENFRETMHTLAYEIEFFEGDDFEAVMRLEMCEDCKWNWINIHMWFEGRGRFKHPEGIMDDRGRDNYKSYNNAAFKLEATELVNEMQRLLEMGDHGQAMAYSHRLDSLNQAWNEVSNNVYDIVDQEYRARRESMTKEEEHKLFENYGWIKEEQEKRKKMKVLQQANFEERKTFYLDLFSDYEKDEYYYESTEYEKRLIEEFKERGEEICNNNIDDNENGQKDCEDTQCGGKICGRLVDAHISIDNESVVTETDLYCIGGECTIRDEVFKPTEPICGNHICEEGEMIHDTILDLVNNQKSEFIMLVDGDETEIEDGDTGETEENEDESATEIEEDDQTEVDSEEVQDLLPGTKSYYCPEDCVDCPTHEAVECTGTVIFSGIDENGCQLEPVCVGDELCTSDEDCEFLCGTGECVEGVCELTEMGECNESMCDDGEQQVMHCDGGEEIVTGFCEGGMWIEIEDAECPSGGGGCQEECWDFAAVTLPNCEGEATLKIEGSPPNCDCSWDCEDVVDDECVVKGDCGGEHDVCSNGRCVPIPEKREGECPEIPISKWCPGDQELCPMKTDDKGCSEWDCGACVEDEEEQEEREDEIEEEKSGIDEVPVISPPQEEEEQEAAPEPEPEENNEGEAATGNVIFGFFQALINRLTITGAVTDEGEDNTDGGDSSGDDSGDSGGDTGGDEPKDEPPADEPSEPDTGTDEGGDYPDQGGEDYEDDWHDDTDWEEKDRMDRERYEDDYDNDDDRERRREDDRDRRENECVERCGRECYDMKIRPCVDPCIMEECGEDFDCDAEEVTKTCEDRCESEIDLDECEDDCHSKCMKGEDTWEEPEWEEHQEMKGVFMAGGGCRKEQGRSEGFIWFGGWGDPFEDIQRLKHKYYSGGEADWCKWDFESLSRQRKEFEEGFNQEFVEWFFEEHIGNSANEWEQNIGGIFELYWRDVEISREMAHRMKCLDMNELPEHNLINIEYESEFGSIKFWEELKTVKMPEMKGEEVTLISPYMEFWFYPSKELIIAEMKKGMEKGEFPGSPEDKAERSNKDGLTDDQRREIMEDKGLLEDLMDIADKYGGQFDFQIQFVDYETDEIVFNLLGQINKDDIITMKPILPSQVESVDATVQMDFEKLYDLIDTGERDMKRLEIESPPWDRKRRTPMKMVKQVTGGVKMFLKARALMNSAEVTPRSAEGDMKDLLPVFMQMMGGEGGDREEEMIREDIEEMEGERGDSPFEDKEILTGQVIKDY